MLRNHNSFRQRLGLPFAILTVALGSSACVGVTAEDITFAPKPAPAVTCKTDPTSGLPLMATEKDPLTHQNVAKYLELDSESGPMDMVVAAIGGYPKDSAGQSITAAAETPSSLTVLDAAADLYREATGAKFKNRDIGRILFQAENVRLPVPFCEEG